MQFFIFKKIFNDANIAIKKKKIKFNTLSFFIIKNILFYDFNLLILNFTKNTFLKALLLNTFKFHFSILLKSIIKNLLFDNSVILNLLNITFFLIYI